MDNFATDRERKALTRKGEFHKKAKELATKTHKDAKQTYPKGSFDHILKKRSTGNIG